MVTVWDPVNRQEVRLLTTLLDVPAELVGKLYRHRWSIELFFRWLKCVAKIKHLYAESSNGITLQFYVVIIATLLMMLATGSRPSVYTMVLLSFGIPRGPGTGEGARGPRTDRTGTGVGKKAEAGQKESGLNPAMGDGRSLNPSTPPHAPSIRCFELAILKITIFAIIPDNPDG